MTTLIMFCIGALALKGFFKAMEQGDLRKNHPEAWVRLQEIERDKQLMRHDGVKSAAGIGLSIARLLMGK